MPKVIPRQQTEAQALFFPETLTIPAGQWMVVYPDDTYAVMSEARMRQYYDMREAGRVQGAKALQVADQPVRVRQQPERSKQAAKPGGRGSTSIRRGAIWVQVGDKTYKVGASPARIMHALHEFAPNTEEFIHPGQLRPLLTRMDGLNAGVRLKEATAYGYCERQDTKYRLTDLGRAIAIAAIEEARTFLVPVRERGR